MLNWGLGGTLRHTHTNIMVISYALRKESRLKNVEAHSEVI
jgi:hypothetical protein